MPQTYKWHLDVVSVLLLWQSNQTSLARNAGGGMHVRAKADSAHVHNGFLEIQQESSLSEIIPNFLLVVYISDAYK